MKSSTARIPRSPKTRRFVLGSVRAAKISAVEGMQLSPRMKAILDQGAREGLSGDEQRALIRKRLRGA